MKDEKGESKPKLLRPTKLIYWTQSMLHQVFENLKFYIINSYLIIWFIC